MAEGRREEAWNHTSHLLAMLHNVNLADPGKDGREPAHFNPMHRPEEVKQMIPVSSLKGIFGL